MKKRKLNYRFHNPNSVEDTADFLYKILIETNEGKVEREIQKATSQCVEGNTYITDDLGEYR